MAPWICTASAATCTPAAEAVILAMRASLVSGAPLRAERTAPNTAERAPSTATSASASLCLMAWKRPICSPNWRRSRQYWVVRSSAAWATPTDSAASRVQAMARAASRSKSDTATALAPRNDTLASRRLGSRLRSS